MSESLTTTCRSCHHEVSRSFRFCPHCGEAQRVKVVEYFLGDVRHGDGGLRASMYLAPPQHVRLSIWEGNSVKATISLQPGEAKRLGEFLSRLRPSARQRLHQLHGAGELLTDAFAHSAHPPRVPR